MVITAEGALYFARENLRLALSEPQDSEAYRQYVQSLREQVAKWQQRIAAQTKETSNASYIPSDDNRSHE